jgi:hypothetical protein
MSIKRSVVLRGEPEYNEEGRATEAIKPGYLVKGVSLISKQTGASTTKVPKALAVERDEMGAGIDDTYRNSSGFSGVGPAAYASGDTVKVAVFDSGDEATVYIASGQDITEDDYLASAGDGTFAETSTEAAKIAVSLETVGVVAVETAIRVRFI